MGLGAGAAWQPEARKWAFRQEDRRVDSIDGQPREGHRFKPDGGARPIKKRDLRASNIWLVRQTGQVSEWRRGQEWEGERSVGQRV